MSLEAWGDEDPDHDDVERYIEAGWLPPDEAEELRKRISELERLLNTPETTDFMKAVPLEAGHQVERWGTDNDAGKTAWDWFWLLGYLAQKAAGAAQAGDIEKAKHHTISTAAALANWHKALCGGDNRMRPGIAPPQGEEPATPPA